MLKNSKKLLAALLSVLLTFSGAISAFAAVEWGPITSSWWVNENFETFDTENTDWKISNISLDAEEFAEDAEHKSVLSVPANKFISIYDTTLKTNITALPEKIRVKFDYNCAAATTLRVELRGYATKKSDNSELNVSAAKYWAGSKNRMETTGTGWQTFDGVFNFAQYRKDLQANADFGAFTENSVYIMILPTAAAYIDNIQIGSVPEPNEIKASVIDYQWTAQADADGYENIYMGTVNVSSSSNVTVPVLSGTVSGFFKTGETYRLSFWFKEDAANGVETSRMWRLYNSTNAELKDDENAYFYYDSASGNTPISAWTKVEKEITIGTATNSAQLATDGNFTLKWGAHKTSEDKPGCKIYISDFTIECVSDTYALSNTVEHSSSFTPDVDGNISVAVSGYPDTSKVPVLNIGGTNIAGSWNGTTADFTGITSEEYQDYSEATLKITDKWERVNSNTVAINFTVSELFADMRPITSQDGKKVKMIVRAPEDISGADEIQFIVAQYNADNILISAEMPEVNIQNGKAAVEVSVTPAVGAAYCRAYGWYKTYAPIKEAITTQKTPEKVLIIGNSFSIDSTRYVNQIAENLGVDLDVTVYEIGGAPVQKHYDERENTNWTTSHNGSNSASTDVSLDKFLTENTFDTVILQNYWGAANGIKFYSMDEVEADATAKEDNASYPTRYLCVPSPAHTNLASYVKEKQPNAQIMINSIWSNEIGGEFNSFVTSGYAAAGFDATNEYAYDLFEKYNGQSAIDVGKALVDGKPIGLLGEPVKQLPVGFAIATARDYVDENGNYIFDTEFTAADHYGYVANEEKNFADMEEAGTIKLHRDGYHLSLAGRYLASCVWVEALTGLDVRNTTVVPAAEKIRSGFRQEDNSLVTVSVSFPALTSDRAVLLREIAHSAVEKFYSQPTRGLNDSSLKR